jgi:hypothetical protein
MPDQTQVAVFTARRISILGASIRRASGVMDGGSHAAGISPGQGYGVKPWGADFGGPGLHAKVRRQHPRTPASASRGSAPCQTSALHQLVCPGGR